MRNLVLALLLGSGVSQGAASYYGKNQCDFSATSKVRVATTAAATDYAAKVKVILQTSCLSCHGTAPGAGGILLSTRDEIVRQGLVDLVDPPKSKLYLAVKDDKMPLSGTKLTLTQKGDILEAIKAGFPDYDSTTPPLPTSFVSYEQVLACMVQDARAIDLLHRGDAANYEWFDLSNLYNTGDPVKFKNGYEALDSALNKTAVNFTNRTAAAATHATYKVDPQGIVRAIFAPDVNKDAAKDFDVRLLVDGQYPFKIDFTKGNYKPRQVRDDIRDLEEELTRLTGRVQPWVRADFAVNQILLKQYYEFLGIDIKRQKQADIEKIVGVNAADQIFNFENRASGSKRSGVGNFNRIVHQYRSRYSIGGTTTDSSLWKTFDVLNEINFRSLLSFPLGPAISKFDNLVVKDQFEFDAGESIGQLPNGEMFFLVSLADGTLLREANPAIVFDKDRLHPFFGSAPGVIVTGGGCTSCHAGGMNYFVDQVKAESSILAGIDADQQVAIDQIYPEQVYWDTAFKTFSASFVKAHASYIADPAARVEATEPVTKALETFLDLVSLKDAAGEFNVTEADFNKCLLHLPAVAKKIAAPGGKVTRDGLNDQFDEIAKGCGYGLQVVFKKGGKGGGGGKPPVTPPKTVSCNYSFVNKSQYRIQFITGWDKFPASGGVVLLWPGDNKDYTFLNETEVDGELGSFKFSARGASGWGSNTALSGNKKISGCRTFRFIDGKGRPELEKDLT